MAPSGHHNCAPAIITDALTPASPGSDRLFDIWDKKMSEFDEVCCPPYSFCLENHEWSIQGLNQVALPPMANPHSNLGA